MYYDRVWSNTERRLLEAALPLVARAGAHAMSFQDLADAVCIRKASVHYHFPTKSDLLIALIDGHEARLTEQIRSILRTELQRSRQVETLHFLSRESGGCLRWKANLPLRDVGAEVESLKPKVAKRLASFFKDRAARLASILEEGRQDGSLRFHGPAEPLAWMILSFVDGAMLVARATGGEELFLEMQTAFEWLLIVPGAERPPGRNCQVASHDSATSGGTVVFRHAPVADANPVTQPASIDEAQTEASPCPVDCLQEPVPSQSETATVPSGQQDGG